jgi:CheY-like chemotaxis protein
MTTSGPSGRPQRLEALQAGAWEFLSEPVDLELLLPRLLTYVGARRAVAAEPVPDGVLH